ncbi:MAG TPA: diaminopimelate epimerase [Gaiellaceae bacterium]|nr:diaminopimelate epimerase [Gaiellaceae bacterium]
MRFSKWHALGNSYLLVERADAGRPLDPELASRLCDPRYGIGSDGVLEVVGLDGTRAEIVIWNPDGSVAEFSGNGSRIAAAWLARRADAARVTVDVAGRSYAAGLWDDGTVAMDVGDVEVGEIETLELDGERVELTAVSVGNPHAVVRGEADRKALLRLGPRLETHARFPERTNVQLVRVDGLNELTVLVWERGAGETSASGSSAVAAAAAAVTNGWCESPVTVHMPGGDLRVELDPENRITLIGPAEEICEGELRLHTAAARPAT